MVTTDCPSLCYGLIQLGQHSAIPLTLTNQSKCSVEFQLKQIMDDKNTEGVVVRMNIVNVRLVTMYMYVLLLICSQSYMYVQYCVSIMCTSNTIICLTVTELQLSTVLS